MKLTLVVVMSWCSLMAAKAMAFEGKPRVMNWAQLLELSDQQQQRIDALEQDYRGQFQQLQDAYAPGWGESFDEQAWLKERAAGRELAEHLREQLRAVLTSEQRQQADAIVQEFHLRATRNMTGRMLRGVGVSDAQRDRLDSMTQHLVEAFEWPVDHSQIEANRIGMERALADVLTRSQLEHVKNLRQAVEKRWPRLDEMTRPPFRGDPPATAVSNP